MKCYELIIKGRVQGVGYRFFARRKASKYGLTGYVKNLFNGDVKIIVRGKDDKINLFLEDLKRGPSLSVVIDIIKTELTGCKEYKDFSITY